MGTVLLECRSLKKYFDTPHGLLHAVDDVNLKIEQGKTLGVVGESGCGKSTLGRTILRLLPATGGEIIYREQDIIKYNKKQLMQLRREMQIIFQDPFSSLDPRMTAFQIISEPLRVHKICKSEQEIAKRTYEIMNIVGLADRYANIYPHEIDGGCRQRIGIARALILQPKFVVCDEPVSALDVSIQAQILNLMMDLQKELDLTYMFITHDLSVVKHISDEIAVMYLGKTVEHAESGELFENPLHPYTAALLDAIPVPALGYKDKELTALKGEISSPIDPKPGCRFFPRCPFAEAVCLERSPELEEVKPGHFVACIKVHKDFAPAPAKGKLSV